MNSIHLHTVIGINVAYFLNELHELRHSHATRDIYSAYVLRAAMQDFQCPHAIFFGREELLKQAKLVTDDIDVYVETILEDLPYQFKLMLHNSLAPNQ